jgi:elongation factor 1-beta
MCSIDNAYHHLASYITKRKFCIRYTPSQADVHVFKALSSTPDAAVAPHAARWYKHIHSYASEFDTLPGTSKAGEALTASAPAPAPAAAEEDDDVDLFGSDDEEDAEAERIKAERVAAYAAKKANKPKTVAKVCILFLRLVFLR